MRREDRVTVQGPVKKQRPDGMSHRGGTHLRPPPPPPQKQPLWRGGGAGGASGSGMGLDCHPDARGHRPPTPASQPRIVVLGLWKAGPHGPFTFHDPNSGQPPKHRPDGTEARATRRPIAAKATPATRPEVPFAKCTRHSRWSGGGGGGLSAGAAAGRAPGAAPRDIRTVGPGSAGGGGGASLRDCARGMRTRHSGTSRPSHGGVATVTYNGGLGGSEAEGVWT